MKILKSNADATAQAHSQAAQQSSSESQAGVQSPAADKPAVERFKPTLAHWLIATVIGISAGLIAGFVVFRVLKVDW